MTKRVIARLDIKGPNLVKGIHLEGLRVLGQPKEFGKYYYENGADELVYQDVVASLYERNSLKDFIREMASEVFIPLTVGGGIRTLSDIRDVLLSGADRVCINTAALKDPSFIRKAAVEFGSSTIVVAIEAIRRDDGLWYAYMDNGREFSGTEVKEWCQQVDELGAGEIFLTSVDREGTGKGGDLELIKTVTDLVSIPVTAHGGVGKPTDAGDILDAGAQAVAVASIIHYEALKTIQFPDSSKVSEGNLDFISKQKKFSRFEACSIMDIKKVLSAQGTPCRLQEGVH